jgi:hypothetical protein
MSLNLPYAIQPVNTLSSIDNRYGPWITCAGALSGTSGTRCLGLTVGIIESGAVVEYWFKTGITNTDLVVKTMGGIGTLTGATNGLHLAYSGTSVALGGTLTGDTTFNSGVLLYNSHPDFTGEPFALIDKQYADDIATGLRPKAAVLAATVSGITLSGLQIIDGVQLSGGSRVLVKNQLSGQTNGIYSANTSTWGRTPDFDGAPTSETVSGSYVWVLTGNTNGNTAWVLDTPDPIIIHDITGTSLSFVLFNHVSDVQGQNGITVTPITGTHVVKLGGTLTGDTTINLASYDIKFVSGGVISCGANNCGFDSYNDYKLSGSTILSVPRKNFGDGNLAIGYNALLANSNGVQNTAIGTYVLQSNTTGNGNIGIGYAALNQKVAGSGNIGIGYNVLAGIGNGGSNVAVGYQALQDNTKGSYNTAMGSQAHVQNTCGSGNTAIGQGALFTNSIGGYNVAIGYDAGFNETGSNKLYIANSNTTTPLIYGDFAAGCVKINGHFKISGVTNGSTSDAVLVWDSGTTEVKKANITLNTVNVYNISANYTATCLSDFIGVTGGTGVCITLPASPKVGQKITVSDVCGNALADPIIIYGNGKCIAGDGCSTINTEYGSLTFINNNYGTWSAVAFVL